jgi:chromosome segregation ATPase
MGMRDAYLLSIGSRLRAWEAEIDRLERRAARLSESGELRAEERVLALRGQARELKRLVRQLAEARDAAFEELKYEIERAARRLGKAVEAARAEFL